MSSLSRLALSFVAWGLLILVVSCVRQGSISGKVVLAYKPCSIWPPDTCTVVSLYVSEGAPANAAQRVTCWPPDTCFYAFTSVPFGEYVLAVERLDSLYRATGGRQGTREVLSYYTVHPDSTTDPTDVHHAKLIKLDAAQHSIANVNIIVEEPPRVAGKP